SSRSFSTSAPFTPNITKLAKQISPSRSRLLGMLHLLAQARLLHNLGSSNHGISLMNKPEKSLSRKTSMISSFTEDKPDKGNLRATFFLSQLVNTGNRVTYPKIADFKVNDHSLFEEGGRNKTKEQIAGEENAFRVIDDIKYGHGDKIPLWLFGFLY